MSTPRSSKKGALLLIGAQEDTAKVARIILEKEGYLVEVAMSTPEGADKIAGADPPFRLCILDQATGTAADVLFDSLARGLYGENVDPGAETLADGDAPNPGIPLLIVAGSKEDGDAVLRQSGLHGAVIVKPYDRDDLIENVRQLVGAGG